jgi:hypothetical protein
MGAWPFASTFIEEVRKILAASIRNRGMPVGRRQPHRLRECMRVTWPSKRR